MKKKTYNTAQVLDAMDRIAAAEAAARPRLRLRSQIRAGARITACKPTDPGCARPLYGVWT